MARIEAACTWAIFVCYLYRNPAVTFEWYDSFVQMLDDVYKAKNRADVLILGDLNIDMVKSHLCWDSTLDLFGLDQLITSPTRTTPTSTSLIDSFIQTTLVPSLLLMSQT